MEKPNPNIFPRGGYYFKESDGSMQAAGSWPGVIKKVIAYRQRAGLPPGDPEAEVYAFACRNNPCTSYNPGPNEEALKKATLKARVLQYLGRLLRIPEHQYISDAEAARRADICARCPKNTSLAESCGSCRAALRELREKILGRRKQDERLNGCITLGEDCRVSVWLEQVAEPNNDLPGECWRKRSVF